MEITVLKAVRAELADALPGARVVALDEGEGGLLFLGLRGETARRTLLISPRPPMPRLHLSAQKPRKSRELTPFAQSLRNAIIGATVESVTQDGLERAVYFRLSRRSAKEAEVSTLAVEFAGKKPELILVDGEGRVALAQSYVPLSDDALRPVLPGLMYQPPPKPDRPDPRRLTEDDVARILAEDPGLPPEKALMRGVGGISPVMAAEAVYLAGIADEAEIPGRVLSGLRAVLAVVEHGPYVPRIYETAKGPSLAAMRLEHLEGRPFTAFDTVNEAADAYYAGLAEARGFEAAKAASLKSVRVRLDAARKKAAAIESDLARAGHADEYQLYGNLLMAGLADVPDGAESVVLPDLFSEDGRRITIPLDPRLNAVKNAEAWFKKARKARSGAEVLRGRLEAARREEGRLAGRLGAIEDAETPAGLPEAGTAPGRDGKTVGGGRQPGGTPEFPGFVSSDGYEVLYGKNARANDVLTFKLAGPMDLWLHAQGYHGSHVIVRNPGRRPDIPLQTILEAAEVAAWSSGARKDSSVAVDYTFRKYVRKPRDPVPGQATFTNNKTVFVAPRKR